MFGYADCEDGCSGDLGDGPDVVADPEVVKVELKGELPKGVTGKDVIVALCGYFNQDQVLNAAIEFHGSVSPRCRSRSDWQLRT